VQKEKESKRNKKLITSASFENIVAAMTIYRFKKSACMHECEKVMIELQYNVRMKIEEE
jgi:hypothetical protein